MAQFIPAEEIESDTLDFLNTYHPSGEVPVPIEEIIEFDLGLIIQTHKGLSKELGVESFLSRDLSTIHIDEDQYLESDKNFRGRFTLAHEVGHLRLHSEFVSSQEFTNPIEWKTVIERNWDTFTRRYETQANIFASYLLMPTSVVLEIMQEYLNKAIVKWPATETELTFKIIAPYAAAEIAKRCSVSEETANIRATNWANNSN